MVWTRSVLFHFIPFTSSHTSRVNTLTETKFVKSNETKRTWNAKTKGRATNQINCVRSSMVHRVHRVNLHKLTVETYHEYVLYHVTMCAGLRVPNMYDFLSYIRSTSTTNQNGQYSNKPIQNVCVFFLIISFFFSNSWILGVQTLWNSNHTRYINQARFKSFITTNELCNGKMSKENGGKKIFVKEKEKKKIQRIHIESVVCGRRDLFGSCKS